MFETIITNATIIDGTDSKGRVGNIAIDHGKIAEISYGENKLEGDEIIDASGLVLSPGFIDIHTHSDEYWLVDPLSEIKLQQGVTTEVIGNCGTSISPLSISQENVDCPIASNFIQENFPEKTIFSQQDQKALANKLGLANNIVGLVGHGSLRVAVMGYSDATPTAKQMQEMKDLLSEAMDQGAIGMSTGLIYSPGIFSSEDEVIELAKVVAKKGGFYASHIRNEAEGVLEAIEEVLNIGRQADVPVHISHLKVTGHRNWQMTNEVIEKLNSAIAEGIDLSCDVYPYFCSATSLTALIPPWAIAGGMEDLIPRLQDKTLRSKIIHDIKYGIPGWEDMYHNAGWDKITISQFDFADKETIEGRTIQQIADAKNIDPFEMMLDLVETGGDYVKIISETMHEDSVAQFIKLPYAMIGSDGAFSTGKPHPRLYGTFPRVIRRFVRELGILSLEEAIHKMTKLPANRLGLNKSGIIEVGANADLVLFDPKSISDLATFDEPKQFAVGIKRVIVSGRTIIKDKKHTGIKAGQFY